MSGREVVEQWLFEYSCRHGLTRAIAEIADKHSNVWSADNCSIPSIYVVLAFIKQAVETQQVKHYEVVVSELTRLYDANGNVIPFRVYMRLLIALKVMILFHMLRSNNRLVLPQLNEYFSRSGFHHEKADKDLAENLNQWQQRFRTTFLRIIADRKQRNEYFEKKFEAEYGSRFVARMKDLAQRFVDAIDGALPPCAIDKLMGRNADQRLIDELSQACSPSFEMLLDAVNDRDCLSENQVIDLLRNLRTDSCDPLPSFQDVINSDLNCTSDEDTSQPVTVIPESPVTAAKRSSSCLSAVNDNDSCSANLPAAKRPRLSDADFFSVSTEPGFHSSRHDRRTLVPATEEDEQSQLQPTESAAVPDSDDFASNGTESNSFKNLICVDTALHDIVLPHEQLSPHMTEYLKFLEQSRLASVDCAAQVDTVSSSVVDSDMAMCDTDGRVSLPGSIDVDDESFVTVLPPALQIDSQNAVSDTNNEQMCYNNSSCTGRISAPAAPSDVRKRYECSPGRCIPSCHASTLSSEESFVSDSDIQSRLNDHLSHLVPSSYSFDQYDVVMGGCGIANARLIPAIEKHRRNAAVRWPCIVKLKRDESLDCQSIDGTWMKMFS